MRLRELILLLLSLNLPCARLKFIQNKENHQKGKSMNLSKKLILAGMFLGSLGVSAQDNAVTIYNSGTGVVREMRELDLKKGMGEYTIEDVAEKIDPATVKISLKNAVIIEQNYKYDLVSTQKIMNKYVGKEVTLVGKNTITGKLISSNLSGVVIEKNSGGLVMIPKIDEYQISVEELPEGFVLYPSLVWKIDSQTSGKQDVELIYQTRGLSWEAEYVAMLDKSDTKLDLNAWINLDNSSGKTYKNSKLKLIAGDLNRQTSNNEMAYDELQPRLMAKSTMAAGANAAEKSFFEYHMYTVPNLTTIANNEQKQVAMFDKSAISCLKKFKYETSIYSIGEDVHPNVYVEFVNSEKNNLGVPLPAGNVRMYKSDGVDKELIGETTIVHTPKDEKLELLIGEAFDVVLTEKTIKRTKISDQVYENSYEIEFRNRKDEPVEIEYIKNVHNQFEILKSNIKPVADSGDEIKFIVPVAKGATSTLSYKVRLTSY